MTSLIKSAEPTTGHPAVQSSRLDSEGEGPQLRILPAGDSSTDQPIAIVNAEEPQSAPPVDLAEALGLVDGEMDLLQDVVVMFLGEHHARIEALRNALARQDATAVESAAHRLKRILSNVGGMVACHLAQQLETMGEKGKLDDGTAVLQALEAEIERVVAFFSKPGWEQSAPGCEGE